MNDQAALRRVLTSLRAWSYALAPRQRLRPYQLDAANAILAAIQAGQGGIFALVFARQAGKDELLAQLIAYLLTRHQLAGGSVVLASPTLTPQAAISRTRLLSRLDNRLTHGQARGADHAVWLGRASAYYLSAGPQANARGATASLLLVANEAQDIDPGRWDSVFDPMGASTNAVTLFSGTVWSDRTLLARQMRFLRRQEAQGGPQRLFMVPWTRVAEDVPNYGARVEQRIAQLGATHPFIRTEYMLEELEGSGGLFPPSRRALLVGTHPRQRARSSPDQVIAILIDVGGQDEDHIGAISDGAELRAAGTRRDSTALTVIAVTRPSATSIATSIATTSATTIEAVAIPLPTYQVLDRLLWTGLPLATQHTRAVAVARHWGARTVVVDATGLGQGLASFLSKSLGERVVLPFIFTLASKSELGWGLVAAIDSGRLKDHADDGSEESRTFNHQLAETSYEVRPGPGKLIQWGVDDPLLHDDLVLSLSMVTVLDTLDWRPRVAVGR